MRIHLKEAYGFAKSFAEFSGVSEDPVTFMVDGVEMEAAGGALLLDALNQAGVKVPQVCYPDQMGPIETCDTCMVEVDGKLVRACATQVARACRW